MSYWYEKDVHTTSVTLDGTEIVLHVELGRESGVKIDDSYSCVVEGKGHPLAQWLLDAYTEYIYSIVIYAEDIESDDWYFGVGHDWSEFARGQEGYNDPKWLEEQERRAIRDAYNYRAEITIEGIDFLPDSEAHTASVKTVKIRR